MRRWHSCILGALVYIFATGEANLMAQEETMVEVELNIEAWKAAEKCYKEGRKAYEAGDNYMAVEYFEKGIAIVGNSKDPALALSPLAREIYVHAFVVNDTLGMDLLKKEIINKRTVGYFKRVEEMVLQLDKTPDLKKEIDDSFPPEKKLIGFLANAYYNLGMIYDAMEKDDLKQEYIKKLRDLGRNDWANEVEKGHKAN